MTNSATYKPSHGHFTFLSGILLLTFLLCNLSQPASVLHVLGHVECCAAINIDVTIKDTQFLFEVWLEGYHLLNRDCVLLAAAMHPKLVDHLFVDTFRTAYLVVVKFESHKLI